MNKRQIHDLLSRYIRRECTPEERLQVLRWFERLNRGGNLYLSGEEKELLENRLWKNIQSDLAGEIPSSEPVKNSRRRILPFYYGIAAVLVLGWGLSWLLPQTKHMPAQEEKVGDASVSQLKKHENETEKPLEITLDDGSNVTLMPGARLSYPENFNAAKREVILEGNAFFDVTSNPERPFLVYHGKLVTQVLGTSFWIRTDQKKKSQEVEVVSGKVTVFESINPDPLQSSEKTAAKDRNGVVLTPNQRVTYYPESGYMMAGLVETPMVVHLPALPQMIFDNENLKEIVALLQKKFGIEIVLAHDGLAQCTFTGDVNGLALYDALELLCKSIDAEYEIKSTRILINGTGCE